MILHQVTFQPSGKTFSTPEGISILKLATEAGINIPAICGGDKLCGKCVVKILKGLSEPTVIEKKYFSEKEILDGLRLACKTSVKEDISVWLLNETEFESIRILTTGVELPVIIENDLHNISCEIEQPTLENHLAVTETLKNAVSKKLDGVDNSVINIPYFLIKDLSQNLVDHNYKVTAVISGNEVLDLLNYDIIDSRFGIAVDLGTTTLVGLLIDLKNGKTINVASRTNPQVAYGADVITRINHIINEQSGLVKLHSIVIDAINEIIKELCDGSNIHPESVYQFSLAGNAIMNHIFLNIDPRCIAFSPYLPVNKATITVSAEDINLKINSRGKVFVLPNISGYVGGDIVGLISAHNLLYTDKMTLALDLGTNGEIVLGSKKRLLCCATAAGPAFEGGHIYSGMRAASGAIDKISIFEEKLHYHVINNTVPQGICGTGLVDCISELLEYEVIDETGRILGKNELSKKAALLENRIRADGTMNEFLIVNENSENDNKEIILKQKDVRELQLAKGAIRAGISILMSELGINENDIDEILIAGAFGSYISRESALKIGLLPRVDIRKVRSVGNSASIGAKQFLLSITKRNEADSIIRKTEYIELCTCAEFQNRFMEEMIF